MKLPTAGVLLTIQVLAFGCEPRTMGWVLELIDQNLPNTYLSLWKKFRRDAKARLFFIDFSKDIDCTVTSVAFCQIARKLSSVQPGDLAVLDSQSFLATA